MLHGVTADSAGAPMIAPFFADVDPRAAGGGTGQYYFQVRNGVITAPVPEPQSRPMLLAGLGLVGAISRRRKAARVVRAVRVVGVVRAGA